MGTKSVLLLLLSSSAAAALGSVLSRTVVPVQRCYSWQDAQAHCRSSYTDLTVLHRQADVDGMNLDRYFAWVGLMSSPSPLLQWRWVDGGSLDINSDLWQNRPNLLEGCAYVSSEEQRFSTDNCTEHYFFICARNSGGKKYVFVNRSMTWSEARAFCSTFNYHLADVHDDDDMRDAVKQQDFPVWTGLYRDGGTWRWSAGASDYRSWAPNQPGNDGDCVAVTSGSKRMITQSCSSRFPSVCFRDNLLLVKQNKTWEEALEHCRAFRSPSGGPYQLVSLQPGDLSYMMARATEADTEEVWTGLRFLAGDWLWMNGADMLLSELPLCPLDGHNCGALSRSDTGRLQPRDCSEERNFLCYSQG